MATELVDRGYVFECEILRTGDVSFTCHLGSDEEGVPIAEVITENGPGVREVVAALVRYAMRVAR